jgi:serine/threonine protein phosphatase PrpC
MAEAVDRDVTTYAKEDPNDTTIGKACGAALFIDKEKYGNKGYLIAAGDSQAFVIHQGKLVPGASTYPQNYPGEFLKKGLIHTRREFFESNYHYSLSNTFGPLPYKKEAHQIIEFTYEPGDMVILASDGIFNAVSEFEVARICEEEQGDPERTQQRVYALAYQRQNSLQTFDMQLSEDPTDTMRRSVHILDGVDPSNPASLPDHQKGGDNLVLAVVTLK